MFFFFFSSRRRHTRFSRDWSSDVCSSDLSDTARADWLQRNQLSAAHVNWWLALLYTLDQKINKADRPIQVRADWVRLKLWLLRWTSDQGVFNAYEHAQRMAYFRAMLKDLDIDLLALVPSADEIVRDCLAAIPVSLDEVALVDHPSALRQLDRSQMWASRQAKHLINAAQYNLDDVTDEQLAKQLRQWIAVKGRLVLSPLQFALRRRRTSAARPNAKLS